MTIAIYCVAYNSYKALNKYLQSIDAAAVKAKNISVFVFVADNTLTGCKDITYQTKNFHLRTFPFHENHGYFGAVRKMMEEESPLQFDFSVISNVDIILSDRIFSQLAEVCTPDLGWIAPRIFSEKRGYDRNPQRTQRYSLRQLHLLRFFFKHPILHYIYHNTLRKRKKFLTHEPGKVYSGHGACIILTKEYFTRCGIIDYPIFLYDEELYLAEQCRTNGLVVEYKPSIQITDFEGVSTSKMRKRDYYRYNYEGINYIINTFYK
ncbi:MAG: glycosyltransferase family 2 protein [Prevotella sp.]|nr:glycosyltransferase family 2 protein [Prevotella sp.]